MIVDQRQIFDLKNFYEELTNRVINKSVEVVQDRKVLVKFDLKLKEKEK